MALVAHDATDIETSSACLVGEPRCIVDRTAAAGKADFDVDEHASNTASDGGVEGGVGVDRNGDVGGVRQRPEASDVKRLVGEEEVIAEPCSGHALDFEGCGCTESGVSAIGEAARHGGRLECLDVRAELVARQDGVHRRAVRFEDR